MLKLPVQNITITMYFPINMKVYTYENSEEEINSINIDSVFLAGPTVRQNQPHLISWRTEALAIFERLNYTGAVIIPEFKVRPDNIDFDIPLWEYNGLKKCDCVLFWIPRTEELIGLTTNWEHGFWVGRCIEKVIYGRPDNAYRIKYTDIMWNEIRKEMNLHNKIHNNLEDTIKGSITLIGTGNLKYMYYKDQISNRVLIREMDGTELEDYVRTIWIEHSKNTIAIVLNHPSIVQCCEAYKQLTGNNLLLNISEEFTKDVKSYATV